MTSDGGRTVVPMQFDMVFENECTLKNVLRSAVAVLVRAEHESTVGDRLEDLASRPGVEVRFTGPWPPYSFAPSFGGES
jgi:hypothetical protein